MKTPAKHTIAIAGAGLLGRLLAWQLLERGYSVTLYEAGSLAGEQAAARTAAGMIAPLSEAVVSERSVYDMGLYALAAWPAWLAQLPAGERTTPLFHQRGSLLVAHPQDYSELTQFAQKLHHLLGEQHVRAITPAEIQQLEPHLNPLFDRALMLEAEAHIDNRALLPELVERIIQLGGDIITHTPVDVAPGEIIQPQNTRRRFHQVIDCRGVGARTAANTLRGVRGEVLHVQTDEVQLHRPVRLMHPRYQLYIVPKPQQRFVIGATQIESEDTSPVSLQSSLELGSALYTLAPAFAEARIIEMDVNLRPAFSDNMPSVSVSDGLICANGLFRHGYLLAPAVVDCVLQHICGTGHSPFNNVLLAHPQTATEPL